MQAPKRTLLAMSPWSRMPPSAMIGLVATRAHHFSALSCQPPVPKPVFSRVMQTLPGPMPTLVASAPQFSRPITALGVAVRDVDRDVVGADAVGREPVDHRVVVGLHARADRDEQAEVAHALRV